MGNLPALVSSPGNTFRCAGFPTQDVFRALAEKHPCGFEGWTSVRVTGLCVSVRPDSVRDRNKSSLQ